MKNYYEVLGINPDASLGQIKDAFRRAAMRWHPDRNQDAPEEAAHHFREASEAYAALSDPAQRQAHDEAQRRGAPHPDDIDLADLFGQDPIDLGPLDEDFHQAMVQMACAMAADGHGRDTLMAALTARGCTAREALAIAGDALGWHARADARARKGVSASKGHGTGSLLLILAGVVGAVLLSAYFFARLHVPSVGNPPSPAAAGAAAPVAHAPRDVTAVVDKARRPALAVAGPQTRLRSGAGAHFPVVAVAGRGDVVEVMAPPGQGFQRVRLRNGELGWIADDALVDVPSAQRLAGLTARQYATAPARAQSLERFAIALERQDTEPVHARDPQAARWWLLEARWLAAHQAPPAQQLDAATAAVQADPSDVDALAALGLASIEAGRRDRAFDRVAYLLARLAPDAPATRTVLDAWSDNKAPTPPVKAAHVVDTTAPEATEAPEAPEVAQPLQPLAEITLSRGNAAARPREPMFEAQPMTRQRAAAPTSFDPPAATRCIRSGHPPPSGEWVARLPRPAHWRLDAPCPPAAGAIDAR